MYRVVKMSGVVYALKIDFEEDSENIVEFVESGEVVLLCNDLEELEDYGIEISEIKVVES